MEKKKYFLSVMKRNIKIYYILVSSIAILELLLMVRASFIFDFTNWQRRMYFYLYIYLFILSAATGIILFVNKKEVDNKGVLFNIVMNSYCVGIIIWSIIVTFLDMHGGGTPIVYLTIIMGVSCVAYSEPKKFIFFTIFSTIILILLLYFIGDTVIESGVILNLLVFEGTASFISYKLYSSSKKEHLAIERLKELSITDQLTNLKNRRCMDEEINNKFLNKENYVFVLCDIDYFKTINDTYGHKIGDDVLVEVSRIIKNYFFNNVYRYGGDEIAIITNESVNLVFEKMLAIQDEIKQKISQCEITISFGIYDNINNIEPNNVFIKADNALYSAKDTGKNKGMIYKD